MSIKILVVEDEAITAMDIKSQLEELGWSVCGIASTGAEAIALAEQHKPDLALVDIILKADMRGTDAANVISKSFHIPIVFLTAYNDEKTIEQAKTSGPYGYILKPFETRNLQITIELALFKAQMERESIEETDRLKYEFLANVTHEIRTPLNAIIGFTELLYNEEVGSVSLAQKSMLGDVLKASRFLFQLLNNIIELTQLQLHNLELHPEQVNLTNLMSGVCDFYRLNSIEKIVDFKITVSPSLSSVNIDAEKFKTILHQIISNAIKFSGETVEIEINALPEGENAFQLSVKDNGMGMLAADSNSIFDTFTQIDSSRTKQHAGTGLGLTLVKYLVEALHGSVSVASTPGTGTTVMLLLPIHGSAQIEATEKD